MQSNEEIEVSGDALDPSLPSTSVSSDPCTPGTHTPSTSGAHQDPPDLNDPQPLPQPLSDLASQPVVETSSSPDTSKKKSKGIK